MPGLGHNNGPTMEPGESWRRFAWGRARAALLPTLPIEVVRLRVKRAAEIGLDYRTYASVRAASGHDVVAFLFSTNALRLLPRCPALPADRAVKLAAIHDCGRVALVQVALTPAAVLHAGIGVIDRAATAPLPLASYPQAREAIRASLVGLPADRVVLVGDLGLEQEWCAAGALAYYLPAERYFGAV